MILFTTSCFLLQVSSDNQHGCFRGPAGVQPDHLQLPAEVVPLPVPGAMAVGWEIGQIPTPQRGGAEARGGDTQ